MLITVRQSAVSNFANMSVSDDLPCFEVYSDSEDDNIFLTQVVKEESQILLNKTMVMDDNFDVDLMPSEDGSSIETSPENSLDKLSNL